MYEFYIIVNGIVCDKIDNVWEACEAFEEARTIYNNVRLVLEIAKHVEEDDNAS